MIVTGANVANPRWTWNPSGPLDGGDGLGANQCRLNPVSCLATHAMLKRLYEIERQPLGKAVGRYSHRVAVPEHPLLREINTRFDVPHSRYNDISRARFEAAGLTVLRSEDGGVHMAVSPDQFRLIFSRGTRSTTPTACSRNTSAKCSAT